MECGLSVVFLERTRKHGASNNMLQVILLKGLHYRTIPSAAQLELGEAGIRSVPIHMCSADGPFTDEVRLPCRPAGLDMATVPQQSLKRKWVTLRFFPAGPVISLSSQVPQISFRNPSCDTGAPQTPPSARVSQGHGSDGDGKPLWLLLRTLQIWRVFRTWHSHHVSMCLKPKRGQAPGPDSF